MACITEDLNPPVPILGCTDPTANNYNPEANQDDGSCIFTPAEVSGCTDPTAINYNPSATIQPEDCECDYGEDCPDSSEIIISPQGFVTYFGPVNNDGGDNQAEDTSSATASRTPREITVGGNTGNVSLLEECCNEEIVGQPVIYTAQGCKLVETPACPDNLTVIEGVLFDGDSGTPVDENCCNNVEGFTYSTNFLNPDGTLGACLKDPEFVEEDCILSIDQVSWLNNGTVVFNSSQITTGGSTGGSTGGNTGGSTGGSTGGNTGGSTGSGTGGDTGGGTQGGVPNEGSSENCFTIDYWYYRPITPNTTLQNPDPLSLNEPFESPDKLLTFGVSELPNGLEIGNQITSEGVTIEANQCFSDTYGQQSIDVYLNKTHYVADIQPNSQQGGWVITTNTNIDSFIDSSNSFACNLQNQTTAQACSVVVGGSRRTPIAFNPDSLNPIFDPCDVNEDLQPPEVPSPENTYENLSEACCSILGAEFGWEYINGVCYWNPPAPTPTVQMGLSETDIQVLDPECLTLDVTASFYLERPDSQTCEANDGQDITASLVIYSGTNINNASTMTAIPIETYSLSNNGYCQWTTLTSTINLNDNTPFKVKVIIDGLKECCNYDIFVDDIAVNCQKQDTIIGENYTTCPGFKLTKVIDNKKSWVRNTEKPINRVFAPSPDADIPWRYTNYFEQSGVYENDSRLVLNSKELYLNFNMRKVQPKCPNGYTLLNDQCIRQTTLCPSGFTLSGETCVSGVTTSAATIENHFKPVNLNGCQEELSIYDLINYKKNFQNFWVKFIEQFVPATTIFVSGEKWSNRNDEICEVIEPCGYINNFSEVDLGLRSTNGVPTPQTRNKNINKRSDVFTSTEKVLSEKNGDYADNRTDAPILFDNFKASFLKKDDSILTARRLTLRQGELELLKEGQKRYQDKFKEKVYIIETNES
jgi:hypothetical protein